MSRTYVERTLLSTLMHRALAARQVPDEHARMVVDGLLWTSERGIDTHGVRLFPTYLSELDGGRSRAQPDLSWSPRRGATRCLDAGGALGMVAGTVACREAIELATASGVGAVSVRNSNHFGAASVYSAMMARAGQIGVCVSNADALMSPFGGTTPLFGTNPISVAADAEGSDGFCLDMATSQVSYSRTRATIREGGTVGPGWAVRKDGSDAAGSASMDDLAALSPLGGYKGQGLAMVVEILSAVLSGSPLDHELSHLYSPPYDRSREVGHFFLALDVAHFAGAGDFRKRLQTLLDYTRAQPAAGEDPIRIAGDLETEAARERRARGIPLTLDDLDALREVDRTCAEPVGL